MRFGWELFDTTGRLKTGMAEKEARDLVIFNANPDVFVQLYETDTRIVWADVCAEPWPNKNPYAGPDDPVDWSYGPGPGDDWPYGRGCGPNSPENIEATKAEWLAAYEAWAAEHRSP